MILKERLGEKHITYQGYEVEIIEYFSSANCTLLFNDGTILKNRTYNDIKNGKIPNHYHPSVYGVAYMGLGLHTNKDFQKHTTWRKMIRRAYCKQFKTDNPSYKNVTSCKEWLNFQNFGDWYEANWNSNCMDKYWHLDKDILVKGNKIYSPETCCFVPREINVLFVKCDARRSDMPIGVKKEGSRYSSAISKKGVNTYIGMFDTPEEAFQAYKEAKEQYIKEVADKWKGQISDKVYEAMYKYEVEVTD
jgi:hypothetical protein